MDDPVVQTCSLRKCFGGKLALDDLSLSIPSGHIHALIGANGAGKSTLFRILLGFLSPSAGEAFVLGRNSSALTSAERAAVGYVNEEHTLPEWMRVEDIKRMRCSEYRAWNERAYSEVIGHYRISAQQKVRELSRGERAGFNLALALAQSPRLLILDEPTLGLDVVAKRAFLESLMYSHTVEQCTIIYCSHQMEEIERIADRLIILERGQLMIDGAPEDFCARVRHWISDIPFQGPDPAAIPGLLQRQKLDGLHHYFVLDQDDSFSEFLRASGARTIRAMPVSLDRAVNAYLARTHAAPDVLRAQA
ncbi:MAG: ABC transporter ATP-binding protein [Xanthomonadales bacterium]|nr:ABC transporter ATP-binding protein [Xanthomonadales bacterium]